VKRVISPITVRILGLSMMVLAPAGALLVAAGCSTPQRKLPAQPVAAAPIVESHFVGNAACAGCHKKEYQSHKKSFHALTAHRIADIGPITVPKGAIPGSKCFIRHKDGNLYVSVGGSPDGAVTVKYGLGSGKTGITFIAFTSNNTLFEMRASYFPRIHQWYRTPGHGNLEANEIGLDYRTPEAKLCIGCHMTTTPADSLEPEPRFLGVGCESCHGPGSAHIDLAKRGERTNLGMEHLGTIGAIKLSNLCGRCHRTQQDVAQRTPGLINETQRFQSHGMAKSRCFKESNDKLTCLTCHNPHANASTDMKRYETACLSCHGKGPLTTAAASRVVRSKPCPVNPEKGCIPCHMPARKILPQAQRSPVAADHFIHIVNSGPRKAN